MKSRSGVVIMSDLVNEVFTYRETAKILKVSERTVWGLVKAGRLQCFHIGRSVRIHMAAINDYIHQSEQAELVNG